MSNEKDSVFTRSGIMRTSLEITGICADDTGIEKIKEILESAGVSNVLVKIYPQFDDWLAGLSKEEIPGLKSKCLEWIRYWGNGGGDQSTETCITDAINDLNSDVPAKLAQSIYDSVVDYSKSKFDAAGLAIEMIDNCIEEVLAALCEAESTYEEE